MKFIIILISISLGCFNYSFAKAKNSNSKASESERKPNQVNVNTFDKDYPTKELEKNGYNVNGSIDAGQRSEVLSGKLRDELFVKVGLTQVVTGWDELQKDLLFLRAKHAKNLQELHAKYPQINSSTLSELMKYAK